MRLQTLQQIQEDDERTQRIRAQRQALLVQRRAATIEAMRRKHVVSNAVELMRVTKKFTDLTKLFA